jgi:hypothetical protein
LVDARFVDEDQPIGIEIELAVEPLLAPPQDVGAILPARRSPPGGLAAGVPC